MNLIPGKLYKIYDHKTRGLYIPPPPNYICIGMYIKTKLRVEKEYNLNQSYYIFLVGDRVVSHFGNNNGMKPRYTFEEVKLLPEEVKI